MRAALDLASAGVTIAAIVDLRARTDGALPAAALAAGLPISHAASAVVGTGGRLRVDRVWISPMQADGSRVPGEPHGIALRLPADLGRLEPDRAPVLAVARQAALRRRGGGLRAGPLGPARAFGRRRQWQHALAECLAEGGRAGAEAASQAGYPATAPGAPSVREPVQEALLPIWAVPSHVAPSRTKAFVDFQNDVTAKDLGLAVREGFQSIEHVKRYTTTGMGTDQGKTSNVNALAIVAGKRGIPIEAVGTTTFRMPYTPVTFGALAGPHGGELFDPIRRTPSHAWARGTGRRVRGCRQLEARALLPATRRGHARRRPA